MSASAENRPYLCVVTRLRLPRDGKPQTFTDLYRYADPPTPIEALRRYLMDEPLLDLSSILPRGLRRDVADVLNHVRRWEECRLQARVARRLLARMSDERLLRAAIRYGVQTVELLDLTRWERLWSMKPASELAARRTMSAFIRLLATAPEFVVVNEVDTEHQVRLYGEIRSDDLYLLDGDRCYALFGFDFAEHSVDADDSAEPEEDVPLLSDPGYPSAADASAGDDSWMPPRPIRSREEYPELVRAWLRDHFPEAADKPIRLATPEEQKRAFRVIFPGLEERFAEWEEREATGRVFRMPLRVKRPSPAWERARRSPVQTPVRRPAQSEG